MRLIQTILVLSLHCYTIQAQEPVQWTITAKKLSSKKYELHMNARVQSPWHVYSQSTPPGGPLATKITLTHNPLLILDGKTREMGRLHSMHDDTFDVEVRYFEGDIDFVQVITVKASVKTTIRGSIEFMACNDHQCLPPKTIPFAVELQ